MYYSVKSSPLFVQLIIIIIIIIIIVSPPIVMSNDFNV